jgi:hypothetical protein
MDDYLVFRKENFMEGKRLSDYFLMGNVYDESFVIDKILTFLAIDLKNNQEIGDLTNLMKDLLKLPFEIERLEMKSSCLDDIERESIQSNVEEIKMRYAYIIALI